MGQLRTIGLLALALTLVAIGAFIALQGGGPERGLGLACMAVFGAGAVMAGVELLPPDLPHPDAQGVTLIAPSRARAIAFMAGGLLAAAAIPQAIHLMLASESPLLVETIVAIVGIAVSGGAALVGLWRLLQPRALYRFDHVGVASLRGARKWFVPWRAVRGIDPIAVHGHYFLALDVDPSIPRPAGSPANPGRGAGLPVFAIGPDGSRVPFEHFAEIVRRHWEQGRLMQTHNAST